jgi:predicted ArsR family transcriptional regulator
VQDTWATRELPVLSATASLLDESYMVTVSDIAARTGLDAAAVARALEALDPEYVDFRKTTTGGDPTFWYVLKVTPQARRAVGQWPTPDSFVTKLAAELSAAAGQEEDVERKGLLSYAARLIGDTLRDVAVRAAGQVLAPSTGVPSPPSLPSPPSPPAESGSEAGGTTHPGAAVG